MGPQKNQAREERRNLAGTKARGCVGRALPSATTAGGSDSHAHGGGKETLRLAAHHDAAQTRAQTFNRIGGILVGLNDFDAALKAFDTALLIYKKLKGGECVKVGQTIHKISE